MPSSLPSPHLLAGSARKSLDAGQRVQFIREANVMREASVVREASVDSYQGSFRQSTRGEAEQQGAWFYPEPPWVYF